MYYIYIMKERKIKEVECLQCNKKENVFLSRSINYKFCSKKCMQKHYQNVNVDIGHKINNWKVISDILVRKNGRMYLSVICTCGSNIEKLIPKHHLNSKLSKGCECCSMFHTSTGYKLLSGDYWSMLKNAANKRNIPFNITIEEAYEKIEYQKFKCALTGLDIKFNKNTTQGKKHDNKIKTASLDRIDSTKGYEIDNIQWVHKDVNIMKNKYNQDYFIKICKLIWEKN